MTIVGKHFYTISKTFNSESRCYLGEDRIRLFTVMLILSLSEMISLLPLFVFVESTSTTAERSEMFRRRENVVDVTDDFYNYRYPHHDECKIDQLLVEVWMINSEMTDSSNLIAFASDALNEQK